MMMISEQIATLQIKHLIQITVCLLTLYLLRARKTYQLVPSWRKDIDAELYKNSLFPDSSEKLPSPTITDLDGDGTLEAVFVLNDLKVEICHGFVGGRGGSESTLPHTKVMYSASLPHSAHGVPGWPVAMTTGYLDQYESDDKARYQVIVILLSNWLLICYDHELNLLWKQVIMDTSSIRRDYQPYAMGIMISPHRIMRGDRGLIIVGGSYKHKGHHDTRSGALPDDTSFKSEAILEADEETFTGFSTFALDGFNGTIRWHHLPGSSHERLNSNHEAHHWKLSLRRGHWPHGKVHWSRFGTYLLQHTPHQWHSLKDTNFDLAHLRKSEKDDDTGSADDLSQLVSLGLDSEHAIGQRFGGMRPHSCHEHIPNPDAIVIHNHKGLEVLSLHSGQLITDLRLDSAKAIYADINNDGSLDQVRVSQTESCRGEASAIHPKPKAIFANDICQATSWWSMDNWSESVQEILPPLITKSIARPRGFLNHLLGKALPSENTGYDSVFVTNAGTITSINHRGQLNWKSQVDIKWSQRLPSSEPYRKHQQGDWNQYYQSFQATLLPFDLQVFGPKSWALISGWDTMVLVHLSDGYTEAEHSLPCQPQNTPVVVDFNGDGWNDVIITCPTGYVGFSIQRHPQYIYTTILSITVILSMLVLSWCCQMDKEDLKHYKSHAL